MKRAQGQPWNDDAPKGHRADKTMCGARPRCPLSVAACAAPGASDSNGTTAPTHATAAVAALPVLRREDTLWLERVTFGLDSASVRRNRRLGSRAVLERQLVAGDASLPTPIAREDRRARDSARRFPRAGWRSHDGYKTINPNARWSGQRAGAKDAQTITVNSSPMKPCAAICCARCTRPNQLQEQ